MARIIHFVNDSDPVDLTLLYTFHTVLKEGSLTAAARTLGRSQPAIWHRIDALEQDLGVPLFEKVGRRLVPTAHARELEPHCLRLLTLSRSVRELVRTTDGDIRGAVRLGTLPTMAAHHLVPVIASLTRAHPALQLQLRLDYIDPLCQALREGQVDLALIVGDVRPTDLTATTVGETRVVAVMAPDMVDKLTDPVPLESLRPHRYLAWQGPPDPTFDAVRRFADAQGLTGPSTPGIPHTETLRELAAAGLGYSILPEYTARNDVLAGRLACARPAGMALDQPLVLLQRRDAVTTPAIDTVRAALTP